MSFRIPVLNVLARTTIQLTWVSSGVTPTAIGMQLLDNAETAVSSEAAVSSGDGHYYLPVYIPSSNPWYVAQAIAVIDARTYVSRALVKPWKVEAC